MLFGGGVVCRHSHRMYGHSFPMVLTRGWGAKRVRDRLVRDRLTGTTPVPARSVIGPPATTGRARAVVLLGVAWEGDDGLGGVGMNRFGAFLGVARRWGRVVRVFRPGSGMGTKEGRKRESTVAGATGSPAVLAMVRGVAVSTGTDI